MPSIKPKRKYIAELIALGLYGGGKRWQYNFDGIDDYSRFLVPIPLFAGDVVEFDFIANTQQAYKNSYFLDGSSSSNRLYLYDNFHENTLSYNAAVSTITMDGSGAVITPLDGESHHVVLTLRAEAELGFLGARYTMTEFANKVIKNLRITRANPTDQYPDLFWPMDDGWANNPVMRQTIPHNHKTDGTESFDMDGAVWLDYETEAAPQYVEVTGYETLAERAALSGLSEHGEAVASCREGLVRNGDFRFGDNGQWTNQQGAWTISNGYAEKTNLAISRYLAETISIVAGDLYLILFTLEITQGDLKVFLGDDPEGTNSALTVTESGTYSVVATAGVDNSGLFFRGGTISNAILTDIEVRRVTDQQVLTPYVNHGEYVNFNEEGWEYV